MLQSVPFLYICVPSADKGEMVNVTHVTAAGISVPGTWQDHSNIYAFYIYLFYLSSSFHSFPFLHLKKKKSAKINLKHFSLFGPVFPVSSLQQKEEKKAARFHILVVIFLFFF